MVARPKPPRVATYRVVEDDQQDTPAKSSVSMRIVLQAKQSQDEVTKLLSRLYRECKSRTGFKYRQHPNAIYLYVYGPNSTTTGATWVAMLTYNGNQGNKAKITISKQRLAAAFEKPTKKAGLTEAQRKLVFYEAVRIEDQAFAALERGDVAGRDRILEQGERALMKRYGLSREEFDAISLEGVTKGWPMP